MVLSTLKRAQEEGVTLFLDNGQLKFRKKQGKLSDSLRAELKQHKADIIELLQQQADAKASLASIPRVDRHQPMPASFAQQRLWFIDTLQGSSVQYNQASALRCDGELNVHALQATLNAIVARHEVLRTHFSMVDGVCQQQISPASDVPIKRMSQSAVNDEPDADETLQRLMLEEALTPFDLSQDLMLRVSLIQRAEHQHILLFTMHHIASDGWSMGVLVNEFSELYQSIATGKQPQLPELPIQYADYAAWQREQLAGENKTRLLTYWRERLAGIPTLHSIPLDYPRPAKQAFDAGFVGKQLSSDELKALNAVAQAQGATLSMLLQSAFSLLISRFSGQDDVVLGMPVAGRPKAELEPLIGFFINTLVSRVQINPEQAFSALLADVKQQTLQDYAHQALPFELLVDELNPDRNLAYNPVAQVKFVLQNHREADIAAAELPGIHLTPLQRATEHLRFDLDLTCVEDDSGLFLNWRYQLALFDQASIERLATSFDCLLRGIIASPELACGQLPLMTKDEHQRIQTISVGKTAVENREQTLLATIAKSVADYPTQIAVSGSHYSLDYQTLERRSNQLSQFLAEADIGPGCRVGLYLQRTPVLLVALLGVLKSGACYVPLPPGSGHDRLSMILDDAEIEQVIVSPSLLADVPVSGVDVLLLDELDDDANWSLDDYDDDLPDNVSPDLDDSAYVIYTSGSTGKPKGVDISHRGLSDYLHYALDNYYGLQQPDHQLQGSLVITSHGFDIGVPSLFVPLMAGDTVQLTTPGHELEELADTLKTTETGYLIRMTPGHVEALLLILGEAATVSGPHVFIVGGEGFPAALANRLQQQCPNSEVVNHYGPTEAVVGCCIYLASDALKAGIYDEIASGVQLPIGQPMDNTELYVLDPQRNLVPDGAFGELYVGGPCLAKGYLNDEQKTDAAFVAHPFSGNEAVSRKLYRTGDRVRRLNNGQLSFAGRMDDQIKLRGFRIEPGEIAAQISQLDTVSQAVVTLQGEGAAAMLVAYIVPDNKDRLTDGTEAFFSELTTALAAYLPDYMVPQHWLALDALPLNANGKVNRKALPTIDPGQGNQRNDEYVAPANELEYQLASLWSQVLQHPLETISVNSSFFALGGNSLIAVKLLAAMRAEMAVEAPLTLIFEQPTIRGLAAKLSDSVQSQSDEQTDIKPRQRDENLPLSFSQQRLWFIDRLQQGSAEYNMPMAFKVEGAINVAAVTQAFNRIIERHEVLRTVYRQDDDSPTQHVRSFSDELFNVDQHDLRHLSEAEQQTAVRRFIEEDASKPFDLSQDLMLRASVLHLDEQASILLFNMHHIASDGWSLAILTRELFTYMSNIVLKESKLAELPQLPVQYADYALWQREQSDVHQEALDYWQQQLADVPVCHSLPLDFERPATKRYHGERITAQLSDNVAQRLTSLAETLQLTPFMLLHGALALVLARHSNHADIVVGTPVANRPHQALESLIGFFVNTLVLRASTDFNTVQDYFTHIRQIHLAAQQHQSVPFEQLVDLLDIPRDVSHTPLFQIMLTTSTDFGLDDVSKQFELPGLAVTAFSSDVAHAKFDLDVNLHLSETGVHMQWTYDTSLFAASHIQQLNDHLATVLQSLAALQQIDQQPLNQLAMLSDEEIRYLVTERNRTHQDYPWESCIHQLVEQQVRQTPDSIALVCGEQQLTYREMNARANQLANFLVENHGVTQGQLIGICVGRSTDMIIAMLAVLKAGAAYVPLAPEYPADRIQYMIDDADLSLVLGWKTLTDSLLAAANERLCVIDIEGAGDVHADWFISQYPENDLPVSYVSINPGDNAYVIYTSGSTGKPKGVILPHKGLVNLTNEQRRIFAVSEQSVVLHFASMSFDAATWEWVMALCNGAQLVIAQSTERADPAILLELMAKQQVTHATLPPAFLKEAELRTDLALQALIVAGEACDPDLMSRWADVYPFFNAYGPSENSVCATVGQLSPGDSIHIGQPIGNVQCLILDARQQLVPFGVTGELYIGGEGLAHGYLNREALTKQRFVDNPYYQGGSADSSTLLYRTGDLVRYDAEGNLLFIGRADDQVKIRGFRIEPGEIEHQIQSLPDIEFALVAVQSIQTHKQLVAWIKPATAVAASAQAKFGQQVRQQLSAILPDYMVPAFIIVLESVPLTPNGKVDKKALPQPESSSLMPADGPVTAPVGAIETALVALWSGLLKVPADKLSTDANFFALGGDSILSIQLVSRAAKQGLYFAVKDLFDTQTIATLAPRVNQQQQVQAEQGAVSGALPFLPVHHAFCNDETALHHFNQSAFLQVPEAFEGIHLPEIIHQLISRHDALRLVFKKRQDGWFAEHQPLSSFSIERIQQDILTIHDWQQGDRESLETIAADAQLSLSPIDGKLMNVIWFKPQQGEGRLLLLIHHLVVDGVSWRIILDDLSRLYQQALEQQPLLLEPKTSSYQQWALALSACANSQTMKDEAEFWLTAQREHELNPPLASRFGGHNKQTDAQTLSFELSKDVTQQLITAAPDAYGTQVNELLLAGLLLSINKLSGQQQLSVALESHGREPLFEDIDLSQTVGWFTSVFPLTLNGAQALSDENAATDLAGLMCAVKEQYRQIPNNGIGFGILKYLVADAAIQALAEPEILFNYLGQFDQPDGQNSDQQGIFKVADESAGLHISAARKLPYGLVLNGKVAEGQLSFSMKFDASRYDVEAMTTLMSGFKRGLELLSLHCTSVAERVFTPSDFPLANVNQQQLFDWQSRYAIDDIYPATGMQQGMLFHSLKSSESYVTQTVVEFSSLDKAAFQRAWDQVIARHSIFRTAFVGMDSEQPHQLVVKQASMPWHQQQLSALSTEEQQAFINDWRQQDKARGFDLTAAPLMRIALFEGVCLSNETGTEQQTGDCLIWSHHHALLDGWSVPQVFRDLTACYQAEVNHQTPPGVANASYRAYAEWLAKQDRAATTRWWHEQVADIAEKTPLPAEPVAISLQRHDVSIAFSADETANIMALAQRAPATVNIIIQAAWSQVLADYSQRSDIIFGSISSGRPPELPQVESMMGLFINAVPVVISLPERSANPLITDWLAELHQQQIQREQHSYLPLFDIQAQSKLTTSLFDSLFVFENYPVDEAIDAEAEAAPFDIESVESFEGTDYPLTVIAHQSDVLKIRIDSVYYQPAMLERIANRLKQQVLALTTHESLNDAVLSIKDTEYTDIQPHLARLLPLLSTLPVQVNIDPNDLSFNLLDRAEHPVIIGGVGQLYVDVPNGTLNAEHSNQLELNGLSVTSVEDKQRIATGIWLQITADGPVVIRQQVDTAQAKPYIAPATETEQKLASIWHDLLRKPLDEISQNSNFFESGGHSLTVVRLIAEILAHWQVELEVEEVFSVAELKGQAELIDTRVTMKKLKDQEQNAVIKSEGTL